MTAQVAHSPRTAQHPLALDITAACAFKQLFHELIEMISTWKAALARAAWHTDWMPASSTIERVCGLKGTHA